MRNFLPLLLLITTTAFGQNEKLTMMSYNLMYYRASSTPCTHSVSASQRDQNLKTIFDYVKPTIFTVNELGAGVSTGSFLLNSVINTGGENRYDKANYSNNGFSSITNLLIFDSTKVGLDRQSFIDKDVNNNQLVRVVDFYRMYYKDAKLKLGADTVFFTVVVCHMKAGSNGADKTERGETAKAIMKYLTDHVADQNVILCGDMNFYGSTEPGFQQFINYSVASERLNDPLNQIGSWNNNSAYTAIHTQSSHSSPTGCFSGGGLDDRFDFFLVSDAVLQGSQKVHYKPNSYQVIGNDGNHFNQSINAGTNTSTPASVTSALYGFSDHLPIVMNIEVEQSDLGLSSNALSQRLSFTNPIHDIFSIENMGNESYSVTITSLIGKTLSVFSLDNNSAKKKINMTGWASGIYIITMEDSHGNAFSRKLIKN